MPRGGTKTKTQASKSSGKQILGFKKPEENEGPPVGVFPLVVGSFKGLLPGMEGYDPAKDRMMTGFHFGESMVPSWMPSGTKREEITAYDFLTFPTTGLRKGHTTEPKGAGYSDLTRGVSTWVNLPPVHIWGEGQWLSAIIWEPLFDVDVLSTWLQGKIEEAIPKWPENNMVPEAIYQYWVTSGEGTPGNQLYRVFELPEEVCKKTPPHHPFMWPEKLRERQYGFTGSTVTKPSTPTVAKVTAPAMPAGTRYRCGDCGHWYTQQDLVGHKKLCGKGEDADWAVMCHNECGCRTLDEACKPKPGFPRPKAEPKLEEEPVTSHGAEIEGKEVQPAISM